MNALTTAILGTALTVLLLVVLAFVGIQYRMQRRDHARNRLLLTLGHDLRQPLQAAGLFADALTRQLENTPQAPVIARLTQSLEATNLLLSTLMDVVRLDMGQIMPQPTGIPLEPFLETLFLQQEPAATAKGLRALLFTSNRTVTSDPALLDRILRNLLVNAIAYTPSGGLILGVRQRPGWLGIQISDTGPGIPAQHLQAIFSDFTRLETSASGDHHLGLGLGVVHRLCQCLGHRLDVQSIPGRGTSFTVWIAQAAPSRP